MRQWRRWGGVCLPVLIQFADRTALFRNLCLRDVLSLVPLPSEQTQHGTDRCERSRACYKPGHRKPPNHISRGAGSEAMAENLRRKFRRTRLLKPPNLRPTANPVSGFHHMFPKIGLLQQPDHGAISFRQLFHAAFVVEPSAALASQGTGLPDQNPKSGLA